MATRACAASAWHFTYAGLLRAMFGSAVLLESCSQPVHMHPQHLIYPQCHGCQQAGHAGLPLSNLYNPSLRHTTLWVIKR
ncbi:hypothetical protein F5Y14DRAFT_429438 [Nemania sp. NC0429]|nr:hypothetical protein F5Y14DRAFT_429438 [Nemania sp. NC0429]